MIDNKKWIKFDLISELATTEQFEIGFCREFFAINQGIDDIDNVKIINGLKGIENIPVNGVAFQSKYLKKWDWTQIKKSLKQILKAKVNKEKPFDKLNKVYVYVKEINSNSYLNDIIIEELNDVGVTIEIYSEWEKIWNNNKYEKLREYFEIKQDVKYELELIERYIENLYLDSARDILDILKQKFDSLEPKNKYKYFIQLGKLKQYNNIYKEEGKSNDNNYYQHFIDASRYNQNWKSLLNKSIGLYGKGDKTISKSNKEASKKIIKEIYKKEENNNKIYGFYLVVNADNFLTFEDILKDFDIKYKDDIYIKGVLGNLYREKGGSDIKAFDLYYRQDYTKIIELTNKITYFQIWRNYLYNKYGLNNLSIKGKNEYLELEKFINSFEKELDGKKLFIEIDILNIKAIINSQIILNKDKADYYFNKILEKKDSGIIRVNKVLNLLNKEEENNENIFLELEEIISKLNFYLEQEKGSPNKSILYQVHSLLAQEYFSESQKRKQEGVDLSEKLKEKGFFILKEFKENYYDKADLFYQRNFGLVDIQSDINKAGEKVKNYLKEDNCIVYNLLAYNFLNDSKYIEEAYNLYQSGEKDSFESIIQLADTFLYKLKDERKFFDIIDTEITDLSNIKYFKDYIVTGINLKESEKVNNRLEEYKSEKGIDYHYTMLKSYFEDKRGNKKLAIQIIDNFKELNNYIDLLFWKSNFQYNLGDESYKDTLNLIFQIGKKSNFKNFKIKEKLDFISSYGLVNLEKSIEICYNFLQENIEDKYLLEFKRIYFKLCMDYEQKGLKFSNNIINNDSIVTIENLYNNEKQIISLDGESNKIYGFDKVLKKDDIGYNKIIGQKQGEEIINLFGDKFGIEQKHKILSIEHKYNHLQKLMFSKYSDEVLGAIKIKVPTIKGKTDFTDFFNLMDKLGKQEKDRKKYINKNFTNKGLLTFKVLKHFYGKSYIDYYYQTDFKLLKSDQIFKIKKGDIIDNIVLDPSSIISIFEFKLENILKNNFNLFISQSTFESFNNDLTELINSPKSEMSVSSDGEGNHSKTEFSKDFYKNRQEYLEKIIIYLKDNCKIEKSDLLLSSKDAINEILGKEFYDNLLIAKDKGYYLFSDEQVLRRFAKNDENKVKVFGIESFLIYLNSKKKIYPEFLLNSYINLINLNFSGILINTSIIYYLLIKENVKDLNLIISYVKNEYNDIKFIISSLIYSINEIHNYKGKTNNIDFEYTNKAKKYYFKILYKIILRYFDKIDIDKIFYELVEKLPTEKNKLEIKEYMLNVNINKQ